MRVFVALTSVNLFCFSIKRETQAGLLRVGTRELFFYASSVLHEFVCLGDIGHVCLCLYFMSFVLWSTNILTTQNTNTSSALIRLKNTHFVLFPLPLRREGSKALIQKHFSCSKRKRERKRNNNAMMYLPIPNTLWDAITDINCTLLQFKSFELFYYNCLLCTETSRRHKPKPEYKFRTPH